MWRHVAISYFVITRACIMECMHFIYTSTVISKLPSHVSLQLHMYNITWTSYIFIPAITPSECPNHSIYRATSSQMSYLFVVLVNFQWVLTLSSVTKWCPNNLWCSSLNWCFRQCVQIFLSLKAEYPVKHFEILCELLP